LPPDRVLKKDNDIIILDITVPFDNRYGVLELAATEKIDM